MDSDAHTFGAKGTRKMVGPERFELSTSCTPCKRATRLRYGPNKRKVSKTRA